MARHLLSTARGTTSFLKQFPGDRSLAETDRRPRPHAETICSPCIRWKCLPVVGQQYEVVAYGRGAYEQVEVRNNQSGSP